MKITDFEEIPSICDVLYLTHEVAKADMLYNIYQASKNGLNDNKELLVEANQIVTA